MDGVHMQRGWATQRGTTLLEVLVSVLIMAVGLLGIAAMQAAALRNTQGSTERSQAVVYSYSIIDAMRANRAAALAGDYDTDDWMCTEPTATTLAGNDLRAWLRGMRRGMVNNIADQTVCGRVSCGDDGAGLCAVAVRWDDSRSGDSSGQARGSSQHEIETRVRL